MAKQQTKQQATKTTKTGGKYGDIWTGNFKDSPAVKKVQADKAKADSNLTLYKKKAEAQKVMAINKAKKKKS